MRILLIYHFFYPDTVISARLFSELAEDLAAAGHKITVFTSNRMIRSERVLPAHEVWHGIEICRFARHNFKQGSNLGRLLNSLSLQLAWCRGFSRQKQDFDAVILGTDPQFGYLMYPRLRSLAPACRLIHWCFDLYPEVIEAGGSPLMRLAGWLFHPIAKWCYGKVDTMVDIGSCMRRRLAAYHHHAQCHTATPWALEEPEVIADADTAVRRELFGEAKLCLLYSGTVGYAHDIMPFIELARECRRENLPVGFCFAGYGNCYAEQTKCITSDDSNITLASFVDEAELSARLSAADFHLISLREGWEGVVVPSKFFGALAMGRPVLFSGPAESEINSWLEQYNLGYRLQDDMVSILKQLLSSPEKLAELKEASFMAYQRHFSRKVVSAEWLKLL